VDVQKSRFCVDRKGVSVIQAPKPERRTMRFELFGMFPKIARIRPQIGK
jgi:hypothetical protein